MDLKIRRPRFFSGVIYSLKTTWMIFPIINLSDEETSIGSLAVSIGDICDGYDIIR